MRLHTLPALAMRTLLLTIVLTDARATTLNDTTTAVTEQTAQAARWASAQALRAVDVAIDSAEQAHQALLGPRAPTLPPAEMLDSLSCQQLYEMRVGLTREQLDYVPAYWSDARNVGAAMIGTVFTPGYYYLGYTAVNNFQRDSEKLDRDSQLTALRRASARKDCFIRP